MFGLGRMSSAGSASDQVGTSAVSSSHDATADGSSESIRSIRPPVPGQQAAHVLDAQVALDQRFHQVTAGRARSPARRRTGTPSHQVPVQAGASPTARHRPRRPASSRKSPPRDFFGLIDGPPSGACRTARRPRSPPGCPNPHSPTIPGKHRTRGRATSFLGLHQHRGERREHRHVRGGDEDGRRHVLHVAVAAAAETARPDRPGSSPRRRPGCPPGATARDSHTIAWPPTSTGSSATSMPAWTGAAHRPTRTWTRRRRAATDADEDLPDGQQRPTSTSAPMPSPTAIAARRSRPACRFFSGCAVAGSDPVAGASVGGRHRSKPCSEREGLPWARRSGRA